MAGTQAQGHYLHGVAVTLFAFCVNYLLTLIPPFFKITPMFEKAALTAEKKHNSPSLKLPTAILSSDPQALRHSGTQALRHSGTQALRHSGTQALRHSGTQVIIHIF